MKLIIKNPNIIGLLAPVFWSFIPVMSSYLNKVTIFIMLAVALGVFLVIAAIFLIISNQTKSLFSEEKGFYLISVLAIFTFHYGYFLALKLAPLLNVFLIINLTGLFIIFYAKFMYDLKIRIEHVIALILNMLAVLLVALHKENNNQLYQYKYLGYFAAFIAVNAWAFYSAKISSYKLKNQFSIIISCFYVFVMVIIFLFIKGDIENLLNLALRDYLLCAVIGIFSMGGSFLCWNYGMANGNVSFLSIISYITPILGSVWLVLLKIENFNFQLLIAVFLIIVAALLGARVEKGKLTMK